MANKKVQNQNKKNSEAPGATTTSSGATSGGAVTQNQQNLNSGANNEKEKEKPAVNSKETPATTVSAPAPSASAPSAPSAPAPTQAPTPQAHHHHQPPAQRLSTSSNQSGGGKQGQKQHKTSISDQLEKVYFQVANANAPQQQQQHQQSGGGGYRGNGGGGGNKDPHKARDKDKENYYRNHRNQGGHQNSQNHQNSMSGGGGNRKKDNKFQNNRDHSSQSHRSGYNAPFNNSHHKSNNPPAPAAPAAAPPPEVPDLSKFPSLTSSQPQTVQVDTKIVQTEPMETKKEAKKTVILKRVEKKPEKEREKDFSDDMRSGDPKVMDTVMAFKEHDPWNKVELMCELMSFLTPVDLSLVGNIIEASVRSYSNQMKPVEKTSNANDPTMCLPSYICAPIEKEKTGVSEEELQIQKENLLRYFAGKAHRMQARQIQEGMPVPMNNGTAPITVPLPMVIFSGQPPAPDAMLNPIPSSSSSTTAKDTPLVNGKMASPTPAGPVTPTPSESTCNGVPHSAPPPTPISQNQHQNPEAASDSTSLLGNPPSASNAPPPAKVEHPVPQDPEAFFAAIKDLTSYVYTLISVCSSSNRRSAAKIADYVTEVILPEKKEILSRIPEPLNKIEVLQEIGKIVSAIIHHPAVSIDVKLQYMDKRDGMRAEIEALYRQHYEKARKNQPKSSFEPSERGVGREEEEGEETDEEEEDEVLNASRSRYASVNAHGASSSAAPGSFFITRFIGKQVDKSDNLFLIEIHWSDGDRTFTQRSREQLKALQHRLLDEFGQQRSEKSHVQGMSTSLSSFDDETNKKLSASTSTMDANFYSSGERIVPRLPRDASAAQLVQYINELSDLPARMMLSAVICEEFNGTRARTADEGLGEQSDGLIFSRWKNPRSKSPVRYFQRSTGGEVQEMKLPIHQRPFIYSNIPQGHMQTIFPSCSNCAMPHEFKNCPRPTHLERKFAVEQKLRDSNGYQPPINHQMAPAYIAAPFPPPIHLQSQPGMGQPVVPMDHFNHHQGLQNKLFARQGFVPEGPQPMLFHIATQPPPPPPPQQASASAPSNSGSNSGSSNSNSNSTSTSTNQP